MDDTSSGDRLIRFGPFEFDAASLELRRRTVRVRIQGQPLQVLGLLLSRPGTLVTRHTLRTALWPEGTYVDFEHGLNAAVRRLRRALDDQASPPRFIETLARRGYRFVASVDSEARRPRPGHPGPSRWSVAVLPFLNATGDDDSDYLVDGLTERVIGELSLIHDFRVIARSAVFRHKGSRRDPRTIGRSLGVDGIVVGTVSRHDAALLIHAELVDVERGFHLWGRRYTRPLGDVTGMERDLARQIHSALRERPGGAEAEAEGENVRLRRPWGRTSAEAHREYLRGRYFSNRMTEAGLRRAIDHFGRAIAADARYALAYCGLADCYNLFAFLGLDAPDAVLPKAREAARTALTLDDELAEAHASLASTTKIFEWDWRGAELEYQRALTLNPSFATAHRLYAAHLAAMGRWDESLAAIQRASELDPVSPIIATDVAWNWYMARHFDVARSKATEALDLQPGFAPALFTLGLAYEQLGRHEQALEAFRAVELQNPAVLASEAHLLAAMGRRDEAVLRRTRLEDLSREQYVASYWFAIVEAGLENRRAALGWLERAFSQHDVWLVWLRNEPRLDPFRPEARFQRLLEQVGLEGTAVPPSGSRVPVAESPATGTCSGSTLLSPMS
jgi:TolB-like protein/tetratricopeptide (TPR) repeat protein